VPPGVDVRGLVSGEELASLYRRTACLVFPSLYEGFGQPPLEAMASGAPVAASNIPAIAEATGEGGRALRADRAGGHRRRGLGRPGRARALRRSRSRARSRLHLGGDRRRHEAVYVAAGAT
jgi:glycosyltransferase involved in cell wall biosynthesis